MLWGLAVVLFASVAAYSAIIFIQQGSAPEPSAQAVSEPTDTPTPSRTPTNNPLFSEIEGESSRPTPTPIPLLPTPTPTLTPVPEGRIFTLSPARQDMGWVVSSEERGNHFGDSFLYAGVFAGEVYHSALLFDLNQIPRGAPIHQAILQLTGLRDDRLGEDGAWLLRIIDVPVEFNWRRSTYQDIFNAPTLYTLEPILDEEDVAAGKPNVFELSTAQIRFLEKQIVDEESPFVSFRLDGPLTGEDNLFAWDTGYGPKSEENKATLILNVGPPPETPPAYSYVVVTSTPTPENVVTAAAVVLQMTAAATRFGTATPPPSNMATATPFPEALVITPTPTPENEATAQTLAAMATAFTVLDGTPTPLPTNAVTATPPPTSTSTPTYVIITATPTPPSLFEVATTIAGAQRVGLPTPFPENWVTPIVVTSTPTPANKETAQAAAIMATAQALTTGTATPTPGNVQTATPTPIFDLIAPILSPTPTFVPLPTPETMPEQLLDKIIFLSDREETPENEEARAYVFDPATGQLGRLTALWPYEMARARDVWSADERFRVFTKDTIRYRPGDDSGDEEAAAIREAVPAIYWHDSLYNVEEQLTNFGAGIAYGGVWSPTQEQIAFVSNDSGDDEIWIVNRDGSGLRQLTRDNRVYNAREIGKDSFIPEINKHPSFSPDGRQIVFYSTRSGNRQLWIMNTDGSEQRLLMDWAPYNDWDPVWVKYLDPPPPLDE